MVSFKNVALLSFATSALACVDFTATLNNFQFAAIKLVDNGQEICSYNGYGDNNGYSESDPASNACFLARAFGFLVCVLLTKSILWQT